jgi:transcriptional regulator with XRE-family HTH domain
MMESDFDRAVASRISALRGQRGLSLEALASRCGVSRAAISRIERGEMKPTASVLARLAGGLGTTLSALFAESDTPEAVARRGQRPLWQDPATGYTRRNVAPRGAPVDITDVTLPAGASVSFDNLHMNASALLEQIVWLLEGQLTLRAGAEEATLEPGDAMVMRLDAPTHFHNPSDTPARYAVVVYRRLGA